MDLPLEGAIRDCGLIRYMHSNLQATGERRHSSALTAAHTYEVHELCGRLKKPVSVVSPDSMMFIAIFPQIYPSLSQLLTQR